MKPDVNTGAVVRKGFQGGFPVGAETIRDELPGGAGQAAIGEVATHSLIFSLFMEETKRSLAGPD